MGAGTGAVLLNALPEIPVGDGKRGETSAIAAGCLPLVDGILGN